MGTREVGDYNFPDWVYNKDPVIEKKGLWPQIEANGLGERFDMAIMASEGFATEAARLLFQRADQQQQYRLFVLHDADPAGYEIARTLREETTRMPGYQVEVTDLGLHFEEALALGLQTEQFPIKNRLSSRLQLTDREREAFTGKLIRSKSGKTQRMAERVEINAFTAPKLLAYIERKLIEAGGGDKVIPPAALIEERTRTLYWTGTTDKVEEFVSQALRDVIDLSEIRTKALEIGYAKVQETETPIDSSSTRIQLEAALEEDKAMYLEGPTIATRQSLHA